MAVISFNVDDDSIPANAPAWDFVMLPKSCSTFPLLSEHVEPAFSAMVASYYAEVVLFRCTAIWF